MSKQEHKELESSKKGEVLRSPSPMAFFDIDGTLTEGYTIFSFAEFLTNKGFFKKEFYKKMQDDLENYRESDKGEEAYRKLAINWVQNNARGLENQKVGEINEQAQVFLQEAVEGRIKGYKILSFSRTLVEEVGKFCRTIAISGSPHEPISLLTEYLGFDDFRTTTFEVSEGFYTGHERLNLALGENKKEIVSEYLQGGIDKKKSFAFGDSPYDLPILEAVDNAFVLGNNPNLHKIGSERNYLVLTNPDEVIIIVERQLELVFKESP